MTTYRQLPRQPVTFVRHVRKVLLGDIQFAGELLVLLHERLVRKPTREVLQCLQVHKFHEHKPALIRRMTRVKITTYLTVLFPQLTKENFAETKKKEGDQRGDQQGSMVGERDP